MATADRTRLPALRPLLATLGLVALAALALTLFAWPQARSDPHELPIGLAGPAQATAPLQQQLAARGDDFDVRRYPDAAAAQAAIEDREVYGAIVVAPGRRAVLTAPAASPAVAQLIEATASAPAGEPVPVVEVAPAPAGDPPGAAFSASVLPLILLGIATGALGALLTARLGHSLAFLAAASAAVGLAAIGIVQGWLGVLDGDWLLNAGAVALTLLAIGATVAGLFRLVGTGGIAVAAVLFVLIGNPWSGLSSAPELLPPAAAAIGQLLPPGAGGELLRETAFFDGAGGAGNLAILVAWVVLGTAALAAALRLRSASRRRDRASLAGVRDAP